MHERAERCAARVTHGVHRQRRRALRRIMQRRVRELRLPFDLDELSHGRVLQRDGHGRRELHRERHLPCHRHVAVHALRVRRRRHGLPDHVLGRHPLHHRELLLR